MCQNLMRCVSFFDYFNEYDLFYYFLAVDLSGIFIEIVKRGNPGFVLE